MNDLLFYSIWIIPSIIIISILVYNKFYTRPCYKHIYIKIKLSNDNNFTNIDSSFIKDNNKIIYWISSNDKYVNNNSSTSNIDYSIKSHYSNNNISNIENKTATVSINCNELKNISNNSVPLYIHYRIINDNGKLSDVYVNKINVSNCQNW